MLAYAYQILNKKGYSWLSSENFENAQNLLSAILAKGISIQIKKGLGREYTEHTDTLSVIRGKINVSDTIKSCITNKKTVCSHDEFSENTPINQILKSTAILILKSEDISDKTKKSLKKSMVFFSRVDAIPISNIKWNKIQYNRSNASYKMLINICYLIINGLLMSENEGKIRFSNIFDEQRMCRLYEKFILEYYKRHFPILKAAASYISWNTDNEFIDYLPEMKSDVTLTYKGFNLIIDAKYYKESMQSGRYSSKKTIHSENLYQIYTYVKNKDTDKKGIVSGMLLYAKTDEDISPDFTYKLDGNIIKVKNLDLGTDFKNIAEQLDKIVYLWNPELKQYKIP